VNFKDILELIDKIADRGIASVEIEQAGVKVKIEGKTAGPQVLHSYRNDQSASSSSADIAAAPAAPAPVVGLTRQQQEAESEAGLHIVTSPIVGTFYRAPNPESDAFVNVGDSVSKGKVLCIIEAMKLMNEIESDADGVVAKIYPQNGQPIEYGEKLFALKK
jgi:acetyl-CoA carboxylase biotin carboxyl carrier protein